MIKNPSLCDRIGNIPLSAKCFNSRPRYLSLDSTVEKEIEKHRTSELILKSSQYREQRRKCRNLFLQDLLKRFHDHGRNTYVKLFSRGMIELRGA